MSVVQLEIVQPPQGRYPAEKQELSVSKFPDPFPGFMASAVARYHAFAFKPQPELATLAALVAMASAIDGRYCYEDGTRINLYGLGVIGTADGKDRVSELARAISAEVSLSLGKPASGQALEDALVDSQGMLLLIDEVGHFLQNMTSAGAPSYLIALVENLLKLWSASGWSEYICRTHAKPKKNSDKDDDEEETTPPLKNPCLNFLGYTTPNALSKALTLDSIEQGLLGRFLFCVGRPDVRPKRATASLSFDGDAHIQKLKTNHRRQYSDSDPRRLLTLTEEADAKFSHLVDVFHDEATVAETTEAKVLLKRSYEKVVRVAGVVAIWDNPTHLLVEVKHVNWAESLVRASNDALLSFTSKLLFDNQQIAHAEKIKDVMIRVLKGDVKTKIEAEIAVIKHRKGWVPRTLVMRFSRLKKHEFDEAIAYLVASAGGVSAHSWERPGKKEIGVLIFDNDEV